jgi:hypothetical protein
MALALAAVRPARQVALLFLLSAGVAQAQPLNGPGGKPLPERKLKAAYLVRFATFVAWPDAAFARPDSPLLIGIAGDDALVMQTEHAAAGRRVRGHRLEVRRVKRSAAPHGLHILFVATPHKHGKLLGAAHTRPVLTVCDAEAKVREAKAHVGPACVIGLHADAGRLRVRVDREEAASAHLRISARLLALSKAVAS